MLQLIASAVKLLIVCKISEAVEHSGNATVYITKAVGDCGGPGSACATDISKIIVDLGILSDDVGKAMNDCKKISLQCVMDIGLAFGQIGTDVGAVLKAIHDCQFGNKLLAY